MKEPNVITGRQTSVSLRLVWEVAREILLTTPLGVAGASL